MAAKDERLGDLVDEMLNSAGSDIKPRVETALGHVLNALAYQGGAHIFEADEVIGEADKIVAQLGSKTGSPMTKILDRAVAMSRQNREKFLLSRGIRPHTDGTDLAEAKLAMDQKRFRSWLLGE